jgi:hypothetical protein
MRIVLLKILLIFTLVVTFTTNMCPCAEASRLSSMSKKVTTASYQPATAAADATLDDLSCFHCGNLGLPSVGMAPAAGRHCFESELRRREETLARPVSLAGLDRPPIPPSCS